MKLINIPKHISFIIWAVGLVFCIGILYERFMYLSNTVDNHEIKINNIEKNLVSLSTKIDYIYEWVKSNKK